jgi:hypothetical protein
MQFVHLTCGEGAMAMAGNLLGKSWLWLYRLFRTSIYWLSKVTMGGSIRLRRRLLKVREKKSLLQMGRRIHELHKDGQNDWAEDSKVMEILQVLEENSRKREELKSRLQEREDRFREKVQKLKEKGTERETEEND